MVIRKQMLRPGDIIFFRTEKRSLPGSWLISWFQNIVGKSPIHGVSYSHIGIVDWDTNYLLDSRWPKSKRRKLDLEKYEKYYGLELWRVRRVTQEQVKDALDWCYAHLGEWYDLGLFIWGMFDFSDAEVCSTFVYKAWGNALVFFKIHKQIGYVKKFISPDEIASNTDLIKRLS